ncbi:MAG: sigma-54-dependent Fis family transcriptional regulator [Candidatus Dadabacteria bacterium]|nr:MAG: sigma-54-dependent Fis family transcriptional regulator [Candidatus Dadabacteria bacterium]
MHSERKKILVVDDEPGVRDSLTLLLKGNYDVITAEDGEEAIGQVAELQPDVVILDLILPKVDGIEALKSIRKSNPSIPIVILSATNTVKSAVQALKCGAVDYISKPFDVEELKQVIESALSSSPDNGSQTNRAESLPRKPVLPEYSGDFGPMIGKAPSMKELFSKIKHIAKCDTTVLISGESGTGKELVARLIHSESERSGAPFIPINCSAIPETLIESELFGHEKGAFTTAVGRRVGHFELADGGTLFLDEIGELSLQVQVKLLRFLQEQEFYRVGSTVPRRVDVRVVAATNRNLEEAIKEGRFREDLYYRLNVIGLKLPPLRDRFEDIPYLAEFFVEKFSSSYKGRKLQFSQEAMNRLVEYNWPGNVRELENVVESLMALSTKDLIEESDLPEKIVSNNHISDLASETVSGRIRFEEAERRFETEIILKALRKTNYVQTRAAELLGISRRILKYKMDKLNISDKPPQHQKAE